MAETIGEVDSNSLDDVKEKEGLECRRQQIIMAIQNRFFSGNKTKFQGHDKVEIQIDLKNRHLEKSNSEEGTKILDEPEERSQKIADEDLHSSTKDPEVEILHDFHEDSQDFKESSKTETGRGQRSRTVDTPHKCNDCDLRFWSDSGLRAHIGTAHGGGSLECPYCSKKYSWPSHLERHVRNHTGEKPYICSFCSGGFTTSYYLKKHLSRAHENGGQGQVKVSKKDTAGTKKRKRDSDSDDNLWTPGGQPKIKQHRRLTPPPKKRRGVGRPRKNNKMSAQSKRRVTRIQVIDLCGSESGIGSQLVENSSPPQSDLKIKQEINVTIELDTNSNHEDEFLDFENARISTPLQSDSTNCENDNQNQKCEMRDSNVDSEKNFESREVLNNFVESEIKISEEERAQQWKSFMNVFSSKIKI